MNKNKIAVFMVLSVLLAFAFRSAECEVKYNGIYAVKLNEEHSAVLRFYEDGTVLASTSVNDYFDVMTWFKKENKDRVLTGKYKIKKCAITFEVEGETGKQSYKGTISGDTIQFELEDKTSKKSTTRVYKFYAL